MFRLWRTMMGIQVHGRSPTIAHTSYAGLSVISVNHTRVSDLIRARVMELESTELKTASVLMVIQLLFVEVQRMTHNL